MFVSLQKFFPIFFIVINFQCLSFQEGNPSLTIFQNQGKQAIYGRLISAKDKFREGESCIVSYFGLFSFGDASTEAIQTKFRMSEIYSIDHSIKNQYFFFQEYCTTIHGK